MFTYKMSLLDIPWGLPSVSQAPLFHELGFFAPLFLTIKGSVAQEWTKIMCGHFKIFQY